MVSSSGPLSLPWSSSAETLATAVMTEQTALCFALCFGIDILLAHHVNAEIASFLIL